MRVMVQFNTAVSASRHHRKYRDLLTRVLDGAGRMQIHHGSDGQSNQWEDTALLNYRRVSEKQERLTPSVPLLMFLVWYCQVAAWDVFEEELHQLAQKGVDGVYVIGGESMPLTMTLDLNELRRVDSDGVLAYSPGAILSGDVVLPNSECGYWTSKAVVQGYANPFYVKMTRSLWAAFPNFEICCESHWGRAGNLSRSGVIPHSLDMIDSFARAFSMTVDKTGSISRNVPIDRLIQDLLDTSALEQGGDVDEEDDDEIGGVVPSWGNISKEEARRGEGNTEGPGRLIRRALRRLGLKQDLASDPEKAQNAPIMFLVAALAEEVETFPPGGQALQLRSFSSPRLPYPALLFEKGAWLAADLLHFLPGIPMTFQVCGLSPRRPLSHQVLRAYDCCTG